MGTIEHGRRFNSRCDVAARETPALRKNAADENRRRYRLNFLAGSYGLAKRKNRLLVATGTVT